MNKKKADEIIERFSVIYPDAKHALNFSNTYELLVSVILSAQCTDKRVNEVTSILFKMADNPYKMVELGQANLEKIIRPCGLYNAKSKHIINASKILIENFGGQVPSDIESLMTLEGVGRKTANVVYSVGFGGDAIAVDTHVFRVANRIGLATANNVLETEKQLMKIIDKDKWSKSHFYLIWHGRRVCFARKPHCDSCGIKDLCEHYSN